MQHEHTKIIGEKEYITELDRILKKNSNSLQKKELNEDQYAVRMNNAIARAVTEIKELL